MSLGLPEIILIGAVALLIFGPSRLPELGKALGKSIKGFKEAVKEDEKKEEPSKSTDADGSSQEQGKTPPKAKG